jgi:hypothetical protein
MRNSAKPRSAAIAAVLAGSWRKIPPPSEISTEQIAAACPALLQSGAGALAWWKLRHHALPLSLSFPPSLLEALRASYLSHTIHAAPHEQEIVTVCHLLRQAGIEAILLKGWSTSRLYAVPGLRPPGDIDLCVAPGQEGAAEDLLEREGLGELNVDFEHEEISRYAPTDFPALLSRSSQVDLNGCPVRVLGVEDQLRVLCLHLLKHGAWRPLWLCDVAAALESRPPEFDWKLCLGGNPRHARWILCAVELARQIVGAIAEDVPSHAPLPYWLAPAVLRQWETAPPANTLLDLPLHTFFHQPRAMLHELRRRWRNPIVVTVLADGEFNNVPKLPLQLADGLSRTFQFSTRRLG